MLELTHVVKHRARVDLIGYARRVPDVLRSSRLRSPHGFFTRRGGVSAGPFASLNTGDHVGDDLGHVQQNLARVAEVLQVLPARLFAATQVHGDAVIELQPSDKPESVARREADALVSGIPVHAVGVKTADCVPILIEDFEAGLVAAVHAGWRGAIGNVIQHAVAALVGQGAVSSRLRAAVGPCIRGCCYEVSPALAADFQKRFGVDVAERRETATYLSLPRAVAVALWGVGLQPAQIDDLGVCTSCDARFFSHRRDQGKTGRQLSAIAPIGL